MITTMSLTGDRLRETCSRPNPGIELLWFDPEAPHRCQLSSGLIRRDRRHWRPERENTSLIALMASNASTSAVVIRFPTGA